MASTRAHQQGRFGPITHYDVFAGGFNCGRVDIEGGRYRANVRRTDGFGYRMDDLGFFPTLAAAAQAIEEAPAEVELPSEGEREPDACDRVGEHEGRIRDQFSLTIVDMNEEGAAFLGTREACERFIEAIGGQVVDRDPGGWLPVVAKETGESLGQMDPAPSGEGWIYSALNEPLAARLGSA